jgi:hypothetical protein
MKAQTAFVWAQDVIVLDSVSFEDLNLSRIHLHRKMDDDFLLGLRE